MFDRSRAYRQITRGVLGEYSLMKSKLVSIPERIATEHARLTGIRSAMAESAAIGGGGGNIRQERDTAIIAEIDRLKNELRLVQKDVSCIEFALAQLDEKERRTVDLMDIHGQNGAVERLMDEFNYSRSMVYNIHNTALDKISMLYNGAR